MKTVNISDVIVDLRSATSQINKHRYLSVSNVIDTRENGAFINCLCEEELHLLEFSVATARDSLRDLAISMEKASILLQQRNIAHNTTALRNKNRELLIMCAISMGDIVKIAYSNDRVAHARTSSNFNNALKSLARCANTSRYAYTLLCDIQNNASKIVLK